MRKSKEVELAHIAMLTIFDSESPLSEQEMLEVRDYAKERIGLWRRRSMCATVALLLSCASVYPFLEGHPRTITGSRSENISFSCRWRCWSCSSGALGSSTVHGKPSAMWRRANGKGFERYGLP
jgi:hypothetical protein